MRLPNVIAEVLDLGGTVVTSSARAARALRTQHGERQRARGLKAWSAAAILDWDAWMERQWQQRLQSGGESRVLLTVLQEQHLWTRLIQPSIEGRRLISVEGVADLAQQAYALLCAYDALTFLQGSSMGAGGGDVENFREWARAFERECEQEEWLSRSLLPLALRHAVRPERPELPTRILFAGFDRMIPAGLSLLAALGARGHTVEWAQLDAFEASGETVVEAIDSLDEISTCAWWVRQQLETAAAQNTAVSLGVILPNVQEVRGEVVRAFRRILAPILVPILAPQTRSVSGRESPAPFEFALGVPLSDVPMVRAALLLLRWMGEAIPQEELTWLMLSGFFWRSEDDLLPIAFFDAQRRDASVLPPEQELESYLSLSGWQRNEAVAGLRIRLRKARRLWREQAGSVQSFTAWCGQAEQILEAAGWPGPRGLDSDGFQALKKWSQLLDGIAMLDFGLHRVDYEKFVGLLDRQARQTIFAPESRGAPVQILGPWEAAGLQFDALWFLGADDANWPAPARPHPFLPRSLQKEHGMPHADHDADWQLAKLATKRIRHSATSCVFSYSLQNRDGLCRPSTLITPATLAHTADSPLEPGEDSISEVVSSARMRDRIRANGIGVQDEPEFPALPVEDEQASVAPWRKEQEAGGYTILKMQAACPFQAFATARLGARELNRSDWGLDPQERGKVLHQVLQELWEALKDKNGLLAARGEQRLQQIVEHHVDAALARYGDRPAPEEPEKQAEKQRWSRAYLEAERARIVGLVNQWLALEAARTPFTVEHCEKTLVAAVGELKLKLRADRIDAVEGGRLLLDYKTGIVTTGAWDGARPDEPQMPLYAAYGNVEGLRGVLLAQIRAGDLKVDGRVEEVGATWMPGKSRLSQTPYGEGLRQQWAEVLFALGQQFLRGEAQVDPKQYPGTCTHCPLPGLCRVAEMRSESADDDSGKWGAAD